LRLLLTFDDGYVGNHRFGLPVLQSHRAPAVFFVSTWHADTGEPFWFDRVVDAVQAELRCEIDLSDLGLRRYRFHAEDGPRRWDDIQELLVEIKALGNPGEPRVDGILQRLGDLGGEPAAALLRQHRPLAWAEMQQMAATGLCHFGTHGHRHEILTYLDDAALEGGLVRSWSLLEEHVGSPARHLAYPNGDVDERVRAACRSCGIERGYLIKPGLVRCDTDPLGVPRIGIGGYDGLDILHYRINRTLLAARRR
jgi:peptidoglycan/xylan/chitin deacetylase (PgdA/CDA1 family)